MDGSASPGADAGAPQPRYVAHGPVDCAVKRRIGLVPGADFDARAAAGALLVANAHGRAFLNAVPPFLVAVIHDFISMTDGSGGTMLGAFAAFTAKILQAEVNRFIHGQRQIRGNHCCLEAGA